MTDLAVRGGSNGIEAHYDDMTALARLFGAAGTSTAEHALRLHGYLVNDDVLSAAVLDPYGATRFNAALIDALDGPDGLTWLAADCAAKDLELRTAAATYLEVDRVRAVADPEFASIVSLVELPSVAAFDVVHGKRLDVADTLADGVAGQAPALASICPPALVELMYPDGHPVVSDLPDDEPALSPPRSLTDVVGGLAYRNAHRKSGDIDIHFVYSIGPDGQRVRRVIVDIPGIVTADPRPWASDPANVSSDVRNIVGDPSVYARGVIEAMHRAGVTPSDDTLLVGHSLGGMVAMNVANEVAGRGEFHITHVITAGAPVGQLRAPRSVQVLSIENESDPVPFLDGRANRDQVNHTTVTVRRTYGNDPFANHDLAGAYVPSAAVVSTSTDPSIRSYLAGLKSFLGGTSVRNRVFHIRRQQ